MSAAATMATPATKARFGDYLELTKPRLSFLSVATALVGYAAARPPWLPGEFIAMSVGTSLCAGGVAAVNQWMERDTDARMKRTADRPIPTGKVPPGSAFVLGWLLSMAGLALLFWKTNGQAALFALLTVITYLAFYTPAKRWSRWSTEIGAVAGAFPPLIGWCAAHGGVTTLGWILFGILLFWQIPHFMAVAWTYRHDYAEVNFPMLPVRDSQGGAVARWSLVATIITIGLSVAPAYLGFCSNYYLGFSALLGVWFLAKAVGFMRPAQRDPAARSLFFTSIFWLPLQLGALVADRVIFF